MKKTLVLLITCLATCAVFAQKVKIKNEVCYVDEQAYLTWEDKSYMLHQPSPVNHVASENPAFVIQMYKYGNTNYNSIRFLDFEGELWSNTMTRKKLFLLMYKSKVFNENGTVNEDKALRFIRTYHQTPPTLLLEMRN